MNEDLIREGEKLVKDIDRKITKLNEIKEYDEKRVFYGRIAESMTVRCQDSSYCKRFELWTPE